MLLNCGVSSLVRVPCGESPLDCKEIQPVHPTDQSWVFIGRTATEAEALILWPPDVKSLLFRKDSDAGKDRRQEEKGMSEDEMVGWHHWPDGHEFEQTPGDGVGWGSLACCSPWGPIELDIMERLNNNILLLHLIIICLSLLEYKMKEIFFLLLYPRSFLVHNSCWINIWGIIA